MSPTSLAQLPSQLARVSRFEKEVVMSPPSLSQQRDMFELSIISPRTVGCVASDIRRKQQLLLDTKVGWSDVREAARTCIPSQLASIDGCYTGQTWMTVQSNN
eukprot:scaffold126759_cov126-Cyclotella_meneghiniana.AAC.1